MNDKKMKEEWKNRKIYGIDLLDMLFDLLLEIRTEIRKKHKSKAK